MAIKYEIHSIHNSKGEGGEQKFVRLRDHEPMTSKQIEQHIEQAHEETPDPDHLYK